LKADIKLEESTLKHRLHQLLRRLAALAALPQVVLLTLAALSAPKAGAAAASPCAALLSLELPQARVQSAAWVAVGDPLVLWRDAKPSPSRVAFCRVSGVATPVPDSRIGFEVWLPAAAAWNGKFLQAGNGGTAGQVPLGSLLDFVSRGYATAATDGGHVWPDGLDYGWAVGHPERLVDFGWRAVERTRRAAGRVVEAGFGRAAARSYFVGCSNGGRDAMVAAQRMPEQFDGIVAGAPALAWLDLMIAGALVQRELGPDGAALTVAKLPALSAAVLAQCGHGLPYVADPLACHFDPAVLACKPEGQAADRNDCLTARQVQAVRQVYQGLPEPGSARLLPGLAPGGEADRGNWDFWLLGAPTNPLGGRAAEVRKSSISESFFRDLMHDGGPFQLADLGAAELRLARERWSATLDATDPDLRAFRAHGGKLLQYHGWTDAAISPRMSIDYHAAVARRLGDTASFHRLFLVPGMNHCGGGAGPWQVDWLSALERWVEAGRAPEALTAHGSQTDQTQVLRPYNTRADAASEARP
jgi:feruloyl esterase